MIIDDQKLNTVFINRLSFFGKQIGDNDSLFLKRIFGDGLSKYTNRLNAIDYLDAGTVLDAGCGFGQWSLALSPKNLRVFGCDISPLRIDFATAISSDLGLENVSFDVAGLEKLPYEDSSFDAVFCYGVIFVTPWRSSLKEIKRVLPTFFSNSFHAFPEKMPKRIE